METTLNFEMGKKLAQPITLTSQKKSVCNGSLETDFFKLTDVFTMNVKQGDKE